MLMTRVVSKRVGATAVATGELEPPELAMYGIEGRCSRAMAGATTIQASSLRLGSRLAVGRRTRLKAAVCTCALR